jgi:hypothetical protein
LGAFRLPDSGDELKWCSGIQAYREGGDPQGPNDGYPGSLYGIGHVWNTRAFEVGIPSPVKTSSFSALPVAPLLQGPVDIIDPISDAELKGLEYLPAQPGQASGKLYVTFGKHYQYTPRPTHGYTELNLSAPSPKGPWYVGYEEQVSGLNTSEYIFTIPSDWAVANVAGMRLACGRHREGQVSSGPTIVAYGPWLDGNPPPPDAHLSCKPLLLYGDPDQPDRWIDDHCKADDWTGGAWLRDGDGNSAAVIIGQKGKGECWYGWQDGMTPPECEAMPGGCEANGYEGSNRGYWASYFKVTILFFDPEDLKKVAKGQMQSWEPQPYARLDVTEDMIQPDDEYRIKTGGVAYDDTHGLLFITEADVNDHRPVVHMYRVGSGQSDAAPPGSPFGLRILQYTPEDGLNLRWEPVSDSDLAGYRVYRRQVTAAGIAVGSYSLVSEGLIEEASFQDDTLDPENYWEYSVSALDLSGNESARSAPILYDPERWAIPDLVAVHFPNPSRIASGTQITFSLGETQTENPQAPTHATVTMYDVQGQRVKILYSGEVAPGRPRTVRWDGTDQHGTQLGAGVYFYRIETPTSSLQHKVVVLR